MPAPTSKIRSPGIASASLSTACAIAWQCWLGETSTLVKRGGLSVKSGWTVVHLITKGDGVDHGL